MDPSIDPEGLEDFAILAIQSAVTSAGHRLPCCRLPALKWFHDEAGFPAMANLLGLSEPTRERILALVRQRSIAVKERYSG